MNMNNLDENNDNSANLPIEWLKNMFNDSNIKLKLILSLQYLHVTSESLKNDLIPIFLYDKYVNCYDLQCHIKLDDPLYADKAAEYIANIICKFMQTESVHHLRDIYNSERKLSHIHNNYKENAVLLARILRDIPEIIPILNNLIGANKLSTQQLKLINCILISFDKWTNHSLVKFQRSDEEELQYEEDAERMALELSRSRRSIKRLTDELEEIKPKNQRILSNKQAEVSALRKRLNTILNNEQKAQKKYLKDLDARCKRANERYESSRQQLIEMIHARKEELKYQASGNVDAESVQRRRRIKREDKLREAIQKYDDEMIFQDQRTRELQEIYDKEQKELHELQAMFAKIDQKRDTEYKKLVQAEEKATHIYETKRNQNEAALLFQALFDSFLIDTGVKKPSKKKGKKKKKKQKK